MERPRGTEGAEALSPWWRRGTIFTVVAGFAILVFITSTAYRQGPPIPREVVDESGATLFTGGDILEGQRIFLKHALMQNGSVWGHGAYLGPDYAALYLHRLAGRAARAAGATGGAAVPAVARLLKKNRYDPSTGRLVFTGPEASSFIEEQREWRAHFSRPASSRGLPASYLARPGEAESLAAFFAWAAWASVAERPGRPYSYTAGFPYDPLAGNGPPPDAVLWSALSLIALLGATAAVLFAFGRFRYLGWRGREGRAPPLLVGGERADVRRACVKFFLVAALLLLAQALAGAATAHYLAEPGGFFGLDLTRLLPSNLTRTWHLQTGIFWVATCFIGGGLVLASSLDGGAPRGQRAGIAALFAVLAVAVFGSLAGEWLAVFQRAGRAWYWVGMQGWEYLDLGRLWQVLLAAGMALWGWLLVRGTRAARRDPERREIALLFLAAAWAIPVFYLPAFFFGGSTPFTVVDAWRFWIIHLWVEGFFELFATVMVAALFFRLGMVSRATAARVIYLDAVLFLGSGIVGTGHHWYWTGQPGVSMALSSVFSAMEPVPLILLTLDAWDFVALTRPAPGGAAAPFPHRWTFLFLMAVGFWNFVGAGVLGFLINLPVVSYYEAGTMLTPAHGHAAMMGVFGMLAVAFLVFALREVSTDESWGGIEPYVRTSFLGLNAGLALMLGLNLFPGGVLQLRDVLENGYWHARSAAFLDSPAMRLIAWLRMPGDVVFIAAGAVPLLIATAMAARRCRQHPVQQ